MIPTNARRATKSEIVTEEAAPSTPAVVVWDVVAAAEVCKESCADVAADDEEDEIAADDEVAVDAVATDDEAAADTEVAAEEVATVEAAAEVVADFVAADEDEDEDEE